MAAKIKLSITTPLFDYRADDGDLVVVNARSGEIGIMAGHLPLIEPLLPGPLRYRVPQTGGQAPLWRYCCASVGYVEVIGDQVNVVATACEAAAEIDEARAREAVERAEKRLRDESRTPRAVRHARHALRRARARLAVAEAYRKARDADPAFRLPGRRERHREHAAEGQA